MTWEFTEYEDSGYLRWQDNLACMDYDFFGMDSKPLFSWEPERIYIDGPMRKGETYDDAANGVHYLPRSWIVA